MNRFTRRELLDNKNEFMRSIDQIVGKYSKLRDCDQGLDIDLMKVDSKMLCRYMEEGKEELNKTLASLKKDSPSSHNTTDDLMDFTIGDDTSVPTGEVGTKSSTSHNYSLSQSFAQPEDEDEELQQSLGRHSESLGELYPSMIRRLKRVCRLQSMSQFECVRRKNRIWRIKAQKSRLEKSCEAGSRNLAESSQRSDEIPTSARTISAPRICQELLQSPMKTEKPQVVLVMDFSDPPSARKSGPEESLFVVQPPRPRSPLPTPRLSLPIPKSPLPTPRSPLPQPRSPLPSPRSTLPQPRSPLPTPRSPLPTPRSPQPSTRSPLPSSSSPLPTPRSALPPTRSPVPTYRSPLLLPRSQLPTPRSLVPTSRSPLPTPRSPLPTLRSPLPPTRSPVSSPRSPLLLPRSPLPTYRSSLPPPRSPPPTSVASGRLIPKIVSANPNSKPVCPGKTFADSPLSPCDSKADGIRDRCETSVLLVKNSPLKHTRVTDLSHSFCFSGSPPKKKVFDRVSSESARLSSPSLLLKRSASPLTGLRSDVVDRSDRPPRLRRQLSFDSLRPADAALHSHQQVNQDYLKFYHKFVCQNKSAAPRRPPCPLCRRNPEVSRGQSSSALAALALSPHRAVLRKRSRELGWETDSQAKRLREESYSHSPGSKRDSRVMSRRCLLPRIMGLPAESSYHQSPWSTVQRDMWMTRQRVVSDQPCTGSSSESEMELDRLREWC